MFKKTLLIPILVALTQLAFAQQNAKHERIKAAKIGFITEKLSLSSEQAKTFWPVYDEYAEKRRTVHKELRRKNRDLDLDALSDEEASKELENMLEMKQMELDLDLEYKDKLLEVISAKQIIQLYRAEKEFIRMLKKRMDKGPGNEPGPPPHDPY